MYICPIYVYRACPYLKRQRFFPSFRQNALSSLQLLYCNYFVKRYILFLVCLISPWPSDGNITCPGAVSARGNLIVKTGNKCTLGRTKYTLYIYIYVYAIYICTRSFYTSLPPTVHPSLYFVFLTLSSLSLSLTIYIYTHIYIYIYVCVCLCVYIPLCIYISMIYLLFSTINFLNNHT